MKPQGAASSSIQSDTQLRADLALGRALHKNGKLAEAERIYTAAIKSGVGYADAMRYLALIRRDQGEEEQARELLTGALAACAVILESEPNDADLQHKRGKTLYLLGRHFEALVGYDRALVLRPDWVPALLNRAVSLYALNRYAAALRTVDRAMEIEPGSASAHVWRGRILQKLNRYEEALASFDRALASDPKSATAYNFRGDTLACMTRYEEAAVHYDMAIRLDPKFVQARWNAAVTRIQHGDFERGWREYECRWDNVGVQPPPYPAPLWLGNEEIAGKTILLHAEQGFGDTIQFVRYALLALERGAEVLLDVQPELRRLISRIPGVRVVRSSANKTRAADMLLPDGRQFPKFDFHCPLMSLPHAFRTTLDTVPAPIPYLRADPKRIGEWRGRIGAQARPLIGVAWSGNPLHWEDRNRSIALGRLKPLLAEPFGFVSLQNTVSSADAKSLRHLLQLQHFGSDIADFDDTAALIDCVDLVVSVDTAAAHLAAAMGKPVWLLLAHAAEWRWLLNRDDTPWYPTMRLFRQTRLDDWESVIERIRTELTAYRTTSRPPMPLG